MLLVNSAVWSLSLALVGATLLPFVRVPKWWIRVFDYPRLQIAVGLAGALAVQPFTTMGRPGGGLLGGVTAVSLLWQAWRMMPYTPLNPVQAPSAAGSGSDDGGNGISLLISNVLQDNRSADRLLAVIAERDPDLILAVETDAWWDRSLAVLGERYPYAVRHPLENTYGMLLYSRLELADVLVQNRVSKDIPSIRARLRLRSGHWIALHCLHPEPPQVGNDVEERDAELLMVGKEVAGSELPTIVCGDLNDVAWSHTTRLFRRISGLLDPRIGRWFYPTFNADWWFARWPLDHVFHDASFRIRGLAVCPHVGSDHFPIFIDLLHEPATRPQRELPMEPGDEEEVKERIERGREAAFEQGEEPVTGKPAGEPPPER
ncbi:endonuclease/exonuclease/phosphatase family protein [Azospirillum sp. SYSU D00513]|uniref:endonuclease/exonuclease/phosphatase family protein n=1 Tax=Azospirillum sp. SYSU D00513 TaxID=2812561 RepID=UPI001A966CEB|nr:endonuclease/exonuclease/phosphatase family protein [Azospirillum sp. SYSU D00513]